MGYTFHFGDMWAVRDEFLQGALLTVQLSALSMVLSLVVAIFGALARTGRVARHARQRLDVVTQLGGAHAAPCQSTGPARSTWLPSGRPRTRWASVAASTSAGRSTPVS